MLPSIEHIRQMLITHRGAVGLSQLDPNALDVLAISKSLGASGRGSGIYVVFERDRIDPCCVVKCRRDRCVGLRVLSNEADALHLAKQLTAGSSIGIITPTALFSDQPPPDTCGPVLVTSYIRGMPLNINSRRKVYQKQALIKRLISCLARYHKLSRPETADSPTVVLHNVASILADFRTSVDLLSSEALVINSVANCLEDVLSSADPAFCHGDFAPSNILVTGTGQFGVLDWELAGWLPPLFDIVFFLVSLTWEMLGLPDSEQNSRTPPPLLWRTWYEVVNLFLPNYLEDMGYTREYAERVFPLALISGASRRWRNLNVSPFEREPSLCMFYQYCRGLRLFGG
jgi:hypothetical protein